jgi:hypothetical protein
MVRCWVTDGGEGLRMWRVIEKVLNKQSWSADKICYSSLGLGQGAITWRNVTHGLGIGANYLTSWETLSFSRRTLFHDVSCLISPQYPCTGCYGTECRISAPKSQLSRLKEELFCGYDSSTRPQLSKTNSTVVRLFMFLRRFTIVSHLNIIRAVTSRMSCTAHVRRVGEEIRSVYDILVAKSQGKRTLGKPRHRWQDNIKPSLEEIGCAGIDRI